MRDPRSEPRENDIIFKKRSDSTLFKERNPDKILIIDIVAGDYIYYRVTSNGGLLMAARCKRDRFIELAMKEC